MSAPGTIPWLAAHELRLTWRDWLYHADRGQARARPQGRDPLILAAIGVHLFAYFMVRRFSAADFDVAKANYLLLAAVSCSTSS